MEDSDMYGIENMKASKDIDGLIKVLEDKTISRNFRRKSAKALQFLYFTGSLDGSSKSKIQGVEWLLTKMVVDIEEKKKNALERATLWWSGKPDPADDGAFFICDVCNGQIQQRKELLLWVHI